MYFNEILQIRYFTTFLVLLSVQLIYLSISIFSHLLELQPQCFPDTEFTAEIRAVEERLTHAALGVFGCLVGALTIERSVHQLSELRVLRVMIS